MNWLYISISIVLAIIITSVFHLLKKAVYLKLNRLLVNQDYKAFNEFINSKYCKFFISKIENLNYRLNSSFLRNNRKDIDECFDELLKHRLPTKYKNQLYMQALNYYVGINDKNKSKEYLDLVNGLANEQLKLEANILYDVYIEKSDKYLDLLLKRLEMQEPMFSGVDEFLISLIYKNKGDFQKSKHYDELAKKHISELDEYLKNNKKTGK